MLPTASVSAPSEFATRKRNRVACKIAIAVLLATAVVSIAVISKNQSNGTSDVHFNLAATGQQKTGQPQMMTNCEAKCQFVKARYTSLCVRTCQTTPDTPNVCGVCIKKCKEEHGEDCDSECKKAKLCGNDPMKKPSFGWSAGGQVLTEDAMPQAAYEDEGEDEEAVQPDVVGGTKTSSEKFPFIVSIQKRRNRDSKKYRHQCGGTLISARSVLTAAHCCDNWDDPCEVRVVLGESHLGVNDPKTEQIVGVTKIVAHPKYDPVKYSADVCVLTLKDNAELSNNIYYAKLAPQGMAAPSAGTDAMVLGFGHTKWRGRLSQELLKADLKVVSDDVCHKQYKEHVAITANMICAIAPGRGSCQGDSGGPLILKCDDQTQIGIVNFGVGCAHPKFPGVYGEVSHFRDWIDSQKTGKKKTCVSRKSLVNVGDGRGKVHLEDVSIGDYVETTSGFEMVWFVEESDTTQDMLVLTVEHECGGASSVVESVVATPEHLLFDGESLDLKRADAFIEGDAVKMHVGNEFCRGTVTGISMTRDVGKSVVTYSGHFMLANGVCVSSYSHSGMYARVVHALSLPFRLLSLLVSPSSGTFASEVLRIPDAVRPGSSFASLF